MYAAVNDGVAVVELGKGGRVGEIGAADVRARYGVEPEQVADFIALRGDPSDGLPGAPGIGAKTAAELLREHRSLEGVLAAAGADETPNAGAAAVRAAHAMKPRTAAALRDNAALLRAFKEVATLQQIRVRRPRDRATDYAGGAAAARELGMARLAERLQSLASRRAAKS
jgi:DNA polymerase-1